jgi:hypothetical protein
MIEKFLAVLVALVAAIEANTAALLKTAGSTTAAPEKEKTKKEKTTETKETKTETVAGPTVADVRAAAQALLDANGNDGSALGELNKKYGTKRISEVPADKFAEVIAELKKLTETAKASGGI